MTDQKSVVKEIILFIRRHAFLPENENLAHLEKMIDDYALSSGYIKIDELRAKQSFEDFMMEKHCEQFIGSKDAMVDDFADWCDGLSLDEWFEFGDKHIATNLPKLIK